MKAARMLLGAIALGAAGAVGAQGFSLEGAVIDSRNSRNLGVVTERGELDTLFKAQKAMTFGILRSAGIDVAQLPPEVRARIERFQTTNLEAFRAFSQGLDLKDQGKFIEAKAYFRRAAELDPGFALAAEQQQAMPDVNLGSGVQTRAVLAAAAGAAVDRSKASYTVDLAHAVAALAAGQTVITVPVNTEQAQSAANQYTTNPPGSGTQFLPNLVAGLSYSFAGTNGAPVSIATVNEWTGDKYHTNVDVLESVGGPGDFQAQRGGATNVAGGSATLSDGTVAYWGSWLSTPGSSATVTVSGVPVSAPTLGQVDYVMAEATRQMPTTGTATFTPIGGSLQAVTGSIAIDFVNRGVTLQNLGFSIGGLGFSGLAGSATYDAQVASGAFSGNYSAGTCSGCTGFTPASSTFGGNFVGQSATGLVFSTFLLTGSGTASGVHLFGR